MHLGILLGQLFALGAVADDHLGAGQVQAGEGLDVLLHRHPADVEEDRPGQALEDVRLAGLARAGT